MKLASSNESQYSRIPGVVARSVSTGKLPLRGLTRNSVARITECPGMI